MKFRKKPVVIEAMQYLNDPAIRAACIAFSGAQSTSIDDDGAEYELESLRIHTLEGTMRCSVGDWIIKGVNGEFYPCKPDIFAATYEQASTTGEGEKSC